MYVLRHCRIRESLFPMLHPAYLLRNPADKAKAWDDLRAIAKLCDEMGIKRGAAL